MDPSRKGWQVQCICSCSALASAFCLSYLSSIRPFCDKELPTTQPALRSIVSGRFPRYEQITAMVVMLKAPCCSEHAVVFQSTLYHFSITLHKGKLYLLPCPKRLSSRILPDLLTPQKATYPVLRRQSRCLLPPLPHVVVSSVLLW